MGLGNEAREAGMTHQSNARNKQGVMLVCAGVAASRGANSDCTIEVPIGHNIGHQLILK